MKVLIAEDDPICIALMRETLSKYGTCHMAVNGREAIDKFVAAHDAGEPFDLVCLDIMMPEMDGQEALQKIRSIEEQRGVGGKNMVKVIMTTALSDPKNIMKAFIKGQCEAYLAKPIEPEKLYEQCRKLGLI